ncbi:MAG: BrnT family toxin [Patescibacteria group bacterium]|jgi:uncharacterized DUF497 family protein
MIYNTLEKLLENLTEFEWDENNNEKNWEKHYVSCSECEQVFFNQPILVSYDEKHSEKEKRFQVLGKTNEERKLFLVFTARKNKIRIMSARDQSRNERAIYEKTETNS